MSHLVLRVEDLSPASAFLSRCGQLPRGDIVTCPNPSAKAPFVADALAPTFTMQLMVSTNGSAIELLWEQRSCPPPPHEPHFEAVLGPRDGLDVCDVVQTLKRGAVPLVGFKRTQSASDDAGVAAVGLHCDDLRAALDLWQTLGFVPDAIGHDVARVTIRGVRASNRLALYVVADRSQRRPAYLDEKGVVCVSLLCRDADRLHAVVREHACVASDCFSVAPFGRPLRVFFARNHTGEIYEFLSTDRSAAAKDMTRVHRRC